MGTYSNRHHLMSDANNREAFVPHYAWFHSGNFFPAMKIVKNPFQATQTNHRPDLDAVPIRSVASSNGPATNGEFETISTKSNKKKPSTGYSNHNASKDLGPKQPKKKHSATKKAKGQTKPGARVERKNPNIVVDNFSLDVSGVPPPFCSCTGVTRGCYKWGAGGWQSSCCNSSISEYPLPMSSSRPGARLAGRKMSNGAYEKLIYRLAAEGHDLSQPVDLKDHWAKHGTNKFVTIK
ncbi:unnamed protein product [Ilex paraguariensis]|uniref:GAGA-binding transcriptional activator n=1 Tax=Ilex paraguariensis TaxID=185542 RepID=A0ABC8S7V6_9AQUA